MTERAPAKFLILSSLEKQEEKLLFLCFSFSSLCFAREASLIKSSLFVLVAMKQMVLKVSIHCHKCKTDVLKAITKLTGIDKVSVDREKGTVTVIGDVDPVLLTNQVRKLGKVVEVVSVGPPKPDPDTKQKPDPLPVLIPLPFCCDDCQYVAVSYASYDGRVCSIL